MDNLDEDHPILDSQIFVDALFAQSADIAAEANLSDLRAMCIALLSLWNRPFLESAARLEPGALAGLEPENTRVGAVPPADALYFGALVVTAKSLLMGTRESDFRRLRELVYSRKGSTRTDAWWKDGPTELVAAFGGTEHTRRRIAHAIDRDLAPRQRIWFASAHPPIEVAAKAGEHLPLALWDDWVYALDPGGKYALDTVRRTFDATLATYGERQKKLDHQGIRLGDLMRPTDPYNDLRNDVLDDNERGDGDFIAAIGWLIDHAAQHPPTFTYDAREHVFRSSRAEFLPMRHWRVICEGIGASRWWLGQHQAVRVYASERLTGTYLPHVSGRRKDGRSYARPPIKPVLLAMTAQLQAAIDKYIDVFLDAVGVHAPVREAVPASCLPDKYRFRPSLEPLRIARLHELLVSGKVSERVVGQEIDVLPRHVSLLAALHPPVHPHQYTPRHDWEALSVDMVLRLRATRDSSDFG